MALCPWQHRKTLTVLWGASLVYHLVSRLSSYFLNFFAKLKILITSWLISDCFMAWRGKAAPAPKRGNGVLRGASVRVVRREKQPLHRQGGPPPLTQGRLLLAGVGGAGGCFQTLRLRCSQCAFLSALRADRSDTHRHSGVARMRSKDPLALPSICCGMKWQI